MLERVNYPVHTVKYQTNFFCLMVTFLASRVIGNHWLLYKFSFDSNVHPLIILGNCPSVCFGSIISIKLVSKFWKFIPHWCKDPEKIQKNLFWKNVRGVFLSYKSQGTFSKLVNACIYLSSSIIPITMTIYFRYYSGVF